MTMQQFSIPCDFGGKKIPCTFYIGQPEESHHPLFFQADWISKERGGVVPKEVMDSIQKLHEIALRNNVSLVELCKHALISANHVPETKEVSAPAVSSELQTSTEAPADSDGEEAEARILEEEKSAVEAEENPSVITAEELKEEKENIREEMLSTEAELNVQKKKNSTSIQ